MHVTCMFAVIWKKHACNMHVCYNVEKNMQETCVLPSLWHACYTSMHETSAQQACHMHACKVRKHACYMHNISSRATINTMILIRFLQSKGITNSSKFILPNAFYPAIRQSFPLPKFPSTRYNHWAKYENRTQYSYIHKSSHTKTY